MAAEEVRLKADGLEFAGELHIPSRGKAHPGLCICHGIPAVRHKPTDKGYTLLAQRFCHAGFITLIFYFRGTGKSEGNLDILGWTRDLQAALDFVYRLKEVDKSHFCLLGFSGGAAVSVYIAARDSRVSSVVTCACPADFRSLSQRETHWRLSSGFARSNGSVSGANRVPKTFPRSRLSGMANGPTHDQSESFKSRAAPPCRQQDPLSEAGKESPPEAAKEAVPQAATPLPPGQTVGYPHKERIMPFIVNALESSEEQVCQLALVWVYRRASRGRAQDYIPGSFVRELVTRMQRLARESEFPNVRRSAKTNLIPITEMNSKFLLKQFENKGALAIDIINELVEMKSPAVMNSLIRQWSYWIAETDKSQLVEAASQELRTNELAILPLLERLRDPLRFEEDEEAALKVKALHQAAPIYADLLLERYVLSPKELRWWHEDEETEAKREGKKRTNPPETAPSEVAPPETTLPSLNDWKKSLVDKGGRYSELEQMAKDYRWDDEKTMQEFAKLFWQKELDRRKTLVMGRVVLQLAEMSAPRFFETEEYSDGKLTPTYIMIKAELRTHAVRDMAHRLPGEEDLTLREHIPLSLTRTVTAFVDGPCPSVGLQLNKPLVPFTLRGLSLFSRLPQVSASSRSRSRIWWPWTACPVRSSHPTARSRLHHQRAGSRREPAAYRSLDRRRGRQRSAPPDESPRDRYQPSVGD